MAHSQSDYGYEIGGCTGTPATNSNGVTSAECSTYLMAAVFTVDDVNTVLDCLSAHVLDMDVPEAQRAAMFAAVQSALKAVEATQ